MFSAVFACSSKSAEPILNKEPAGNTAFSTVVEVDVFVNVCITSVIISVFVSVFISLIMHRPFSSVLLLPVHTQLPFW